MLKSMTFNNARNNSIYLLRGRSKSPFHPVEREITRIGKHHRLRKTERGLLEISQHVGFFAKEDETQMDIIEQLTSWLMTDDWGILEFDDEPGRRYVAILQNDMADFEKISWLREGTLEFVAKETLGDTHELTIGTSSAYHNIKGQTETPWTSRTVFKKSEDHFFIKGAYGRNITLNYNFIEGDVLEIDYDKRDVFLNGNDLATAVSLQTNWFELPVGNVRLEASHDTTIYYDERYY